MEPDIRLLATLADLEEQAAIARDRAAEAQARAVTAQERASKLRRAVEAIRELVPTAPQAPPPTNGSVPVTMDGRPLLRDAIPTVLREQGQLTILEIAQSLRDRGWLGGSGERPSVETIRPVLDTLREKGIAESEIRLGQKAAVWRLTNKLLPVAPFGPGDTTP